VKKLAHFEKIELKAGESRTMRFVISPDEHLWYPDEQGQRILESGRFFLSVENLREAFRLE
jgi:beta-glucosidase